MLQKLPFGLMDEMVEVLQKFLHSQASGAVDDLFDADGVIKAIFSGKLDALEPNDLLMRYRVQDALQHLEEWIEAHAGEDVELHSPLDAANSTIDVFLEKWLEHLTQREWNVDTPFETFDSTVRYVTSLSPFGEWSPQEFLTHLQESAPNTLKSAPAKTESSIKSSMEAAGETVEGLELIEAAEAIESTAGVPWVVQPRTCCFKR